MDAVATDACENGARGRRKLMILDLDRIRGNKYQERSKPRAGSERCRLAISCTDNYGNVM